MYTLRVFSWILGLCSIFAVQACQNDQRYSPTQKPENTPSVAPAYNCRPQIIQVAEENVTVRVGSWRYVFNVLITGCSESLGTLSKVHQEEILQIATQEVNAQGMDVMVEYKSPEFQDRFSKLINQKLGHELVSDAYLNIVSIGEEM